MPADLSAPDQEAHKPAPSETWLSILVPVYNVEPWLRECVDSIMSQGNLDGVEIFLLDDASTDGSRALAESLCAEYGPRLSLLCHAENAGLSAARNSLLDAAHGEYIWFLDSDDKMLPGALHSLRTIVFEHHPDLVLCDFEKGSTKQKSTFRGATRQLGHDRTALVRGVFANRRMHSWSKISRRSLWGDSLRFPVSKSFEDIATTPWLLLKARSFYHVPESWVWYRVRSGSIMAAVSKTPAVFDTVRNDELAQALLGFREALVDALGEIDPDTQYFIGHFCAKEYVKIAERVIRAKVPARSWQEKRRELTRYLATTQSCSPITFRQLSRDYLRRLRPDRWLHLRGLMRLALAAPE